jgi:hypothetical protein
MARGDIAPRAARMIGSTFAACRSGFVSDDKSDTPYEETKSGKKVTATEKS